MPLTKQQIMLDGKVKLTPRRREILFHIACTDGIWWREERDWSHRCENHKIFVPYLGETAVTTIVAYLKQKRLIAWSKEGGLPRFARQPYAHPPILLVTPRGMDALLECLEFRKEVTL